MTVNLKREERCRDVSRLQSTPHITVRPSVRFRIRYPHPISSFKSNKHVSLTSPVSVPGSRLIILGAASLVGFRHQKLDETRRDVADTYFYCYPWNNEQASCRGLVKKKYLLTRASPVPYICPVQVVPDTIRQAKRTDIHRQRVACYRKRAGPVSAVPAVGVIWFLVLPRS